MVAALLYLYSKSRSFNFELCCTPSTLRLPLWHCLISSTYKPATPYPAAGRGARRGGRRGVLFLTGRRPARGPGCYTTPYLVLQYTEQLQHRQRHLDAGPLEDTGHR